MGERGETWRPGLAGVLRHRLPGAGPGLGWLLRAAALTLGRGLAVENAGRLAAGDPLILALNHSNSIESLAVPATLQLLRGGRPAAFLVDWMYLEIPVTGWLIRSCDPIPVWRKRARWGLWDSRRRAGAGRDPVAEALGRLAAGRSVGVFPEGTRNRRADRLLRGRPGLGRLVLASTAPVVPVGIHYPAAGRLGRVPRLGRAVVRIGTPLDFAAERAARHEAGEAPPPGLERRLGHAVVERVMAELAELSGKAAPRRPVRPRAAQPIPPSAPRSDPETITDERSRGMSLRSVRTEKVLSAEARERALRVVEEVYLREKQWIDPGSLAAELPRDPAGATGVSWFLVTAGGEPAGLVRLVYDPPLELPAEHEVTLDPGLDVARLTSQGRFVDVGRLMILPRHRRRVAVVLSLMKAAAREAVERGYTHLITDVFEDDPHSPLAFHTRVLGFERIGSHRFGELRCRSRRIILMLDLARAYERLRHRKNRVLREFCDGVRDAFEGRAACGTPAAPA